jgi:hypothetical protein
LIEILHTYFISNIFKEENLLKSYLDIMLCTDIFKYLIENDTKGDYFRMLTSIMQKFYLKNMENKTNQKSNKKEKKDENIKKEDTQNNDKNINIEDKSDKIDNIKSNQELKDDIDIIKSKNSQKEEENIENNENKINVTPNDKEYKETNDVKEKDEINNNEKIEKEDKENRVFFTPTRLLVISLDHTSIVFNGRMNTFLCSTIFPKSFLFGFTGRSGTFHRFLP